MKEIKENIQLKAKLEEYKQIRNDIRQLFERRDRTFYLAFFVFIGVISVGIPFKNSILFFMTSIILLFLWTREIIRQIAIQRINTYISVNIEEYIQGLERTSIGKFHHYSKSLFRAIPYLALPLLAFICYLLGIYYYSNSCNPIIPFFWYLFFKYSIPIFSIYLIIKTFCVVKYGRHIEEKNWKEAKEKYEDIKKSKN